MYIISRDMNDKESVTYTMRETLFDVMRVYINLVHDYNQTGKCTFWIMHPTTILFNEFSNH